MRLHRVANIVLVLALTPVAAFSIWTRWPGTEGWDAWWSSCNAHNDWALIYGSDQYVTGYDSGGRVFCHPGTPICKVCAPNWRTAYLKARYYSTRPGPYGPENPMLCEKADGWFYQDGQCCAWNSGDVDVYGMTIYAPPP